MKIHYLFALGLMAAGPAALAQYTQPYQQPQYSQPAQPQYSPSPQSYPAQQYPNQQYSAPQYPAQYGPVGSFSPPQLDQLVSPIALYPDPLLGAMLPASTHPDQIAAAANFDASVSDPNQIDQQPWDDSVKAVAHYPSVVEWMAQNTDWTNQLGAAVASQEPDVMNAVQQLRANARASGMLVDTPQQRVVDQNNVITILPAQPNTIYVPTYNPQWIESAPPPGAQFSMSFGPAFALGNWPQYDLDWRQHSVWIDRSHERGERDEHHFWQFSRSHREQRQEWQPPREMQMREREAGTRPQSIARPQPFGSERSEHVLTPTGRTNSPAMEYDQRNRSRQPQMQSEHDNRYQQNNRSRREDHRDHRDEDDHHDDDR